MVNLVPCECPKPDEYLRCFRNGDRLLTVWVEDAELEVEKLAREFSVKTEMRYSWHVSIGAHPSVPTDEEIAAVLEKVELAGRAWFETPAAINRHVRHVFIR